MNSGELLALDPVIPIATIERIEDAVPLARAIQNGGLQTLEVTLRTPIALAAIELIADRFPELIVGAGTVLGRTQIEAAERAGARFLVTPGTTPRQLDHLEASGLPFLCGCSTASDVVALLDRGIREMKLFPAEAIGGIEMVKALAGPFSEVCFCPTGGITRETAPAYLALPNVGAVGGSWITARPGGRDDWRCVAAAAHDAARLRWSRR
jgi:2-dehydro-3-deoxyphosphogluconate aldolase / (4S)-4-hydroxy-2-oxoglutarate aldolase